MEIEKYGIKLVSLTRDKIELVRQWRNSEAIKRYMFFQKEITSEMQEKWFESIDNDSNIYATICYNAEDIGLSSIKNIDKEQKRCDLGLFIAKEEWLNSDVPVRTSLCGIDFCFEQLALNELYIQVREDNPRAIRYNRALGFIEDNAAESYVINMVLTKGNYYEQREKLLDLLI